MGGSAFWHYEYTADCFCGRRTTSADRQVAQVRMGPAASRRTFHLQLKITCGSFISWNRKERYMSKKATVSLYEGQELKQTLSVTLDELESKLVLLRRLNDYVEVKHPDWKKSKVYLRLPIPKKYSVPRHKFRQSLDGRSLYLPSRHDTRRK